MKKYIFGIIVGFSVATAHAAIGGGPGGLSYNFIENNGSTVTQRQTLNFTGSGVVCVDNSGQLRTDCTITAGGGGGSGSLQVFSNFDGTRSSPTASIAIGDSLKLSVVGSTAVINVDFSSVTSRSDVILNQNFEQIGSTFSVSSGSVHGKLIVFGGSIRTILLPSTTVNMQMINISSHQVFTLITSSGTDWWRIGSDVTNNGFPEYDIYNVTTGVKDVAISTNDIMTINATEVFPSLTASQPVKLNSSKQLITGLINATSDITGTIPDSNLPSNLVHTNVQETISSSKIFTSSQTFNFGLTTSSATVSNLTAGNCVQAGTNGLLTTAGLPCGSGSGGTTVYNATATAGFPFGLSVTTLTVTQTVNFNSVGNINFNANTNLNISSGATFNSLANSSTTFKGIFLDSTSSAGTSGQVYTSNGPGNSPTWKTSSGGGGSVILSTMTAGATNFLFNTNVLQSGSTGYPQFLYVGSSITVDNGELLINHNSTSLKYSGASGDPALTLDDSNGSGGGSLNFTRLGIQKAQFLKLSNGWEISTDTNSTGAAIAQPRLFFSNQNNGDVSVLGSTFGVNGVSYTWPSADGTNGQVLSTNGSRVLNFATTSSGVSVYSATATASFPFGLSASTITVNNTVVNTPAAIFESSITSSNQTEAIGVYNTGNQGSTASGGGFNFYLINSLGLIKSFSKIFDSGRQFIDGSESGYLKLFTKTGGSYPTNPQLAINGNNGLEITVPFYNPSSSQIIYGSAANSAISILFQTSVNPLAISYDGNARTWDFSKRISASTYTATAAGGFRAYNDAGTHYVFHRAQTSLATDTTYYWGADGSNGQVISTNGSGVLTPKTGGNMHYLDFEIGVTPTTCTQNISGAGFCAAGPTSSITTSAGVSQVFVEVCGLLETANINSSSAYLTIFRNGSDLSSLGYGSAGFASLGSNAISGDVQQTTCAVFVDKGAAANTAYTYQAGIGNGDGSTTITYGGIPIACPTTAPGPTTITVEEILP